MLNLVSSLAADFGDQVRIHDAFFWLRKHEIT